MECEFLEVVEDKNLNCVDFINQDEEYCDRNSSEQMEADFNSFMSFLEKEAA